MSTTAFVTWNSRNKKHYVEKNYVFTKIGDVFQANVSDLTIGSRAIVDVSCDYCGKILHKTYDSFNAGRRGGVLVDSCDNPDCEKKKAKAVILYKYGVNHIRELDFVNTKIAQTNRERYGCDNPFGNSGIQQKIKKTNIAKYGVPNAMQNPECLAKTQRTTFDKYGVTSYVELFKGKFVRENSPCWKGGFVATSRNRKCYEYKQWRNSVFSRDNYTCQKCGAHSEQGSGTVVLAGHHIVNWKSDESQRYVVDNGITLCEDCHRQFHKIYGNTNNSKEQLNEFLFCRKDKKIC